MKHILITTIAAVLVVGCKSTSIHKAAGAGNIEAVKQHLAAGANVNAPDTYGYTSLHKASSEGHKEIVELLIAKGADVNAKGLGDRTPLFNAAYSGHKEIAELLIAEGADVNAIIVSGRNQGKTPLDLAIWRKKTETADLLRKHGGKTGAWLSADESIHIAAQAGHIEAVKQHLAAGTDVNAKSRFDGTPLLHAAVDGHKDVVELLIAKGADVNAKDRRGWTPLHGAAVEGHKEIAELLITKGADVNAKDVFHRKTTLDEAIFSNHSEIADLLRKHGGKTGAWLSADESIHIAAQAGHIEAVKQHIAAGADVNAKMFNGNTPLDWAIDFKRIKTADLLRKHGAKTGEELKAEGK